MNVVLKLVETRGAIISHCASIKQVCDLLEAGNIPAAVAKLEGACSALLAATRSEVGDQAYECPACGTESLVAAWGDAMGYCPNCGVHIDPITGEQN